VLPAISADGKIIMKTPYEMQLSPNGNGAFFDAVNSNKIVKNHIIKTEIV